MSEKKKEWFVEVVSLETNEVVHRVACSSERAADRVENGMNINLAHDKFYTRIATSVSDTRG